jgi:hypothetical protein
MPRLFFNAKNVIIGTAMMLTVSLSSAYTTGRAVARSSSVSLKSSDKIIPVRIARGELSVHISGRFTPRNAEHWYRIDAKAGQRMIINLISRSEGMSTAGVVRSPSGEQDGQPGGVIYDHILKESGAYLLRVFPHQMASKLIGDYSAEVIVFPSYMIR